MIFHVFQQNDLIKARFENIREIKSNKLEEKIFWSKIKSRK